MTPPAGMRDLWRVSLGIIFVGCAAAAPAATTAPEPTASPVASATPISSATPTAAPTQRSTARPTPTPTAEAYVFPTELFGGLSDEPVSDELAAELQEVLERSANGDGLTATLITPQGTWSGATGMATAERAMVPNDQMSIASITKTLVAAQIMQLVEAGELGLEDLAVDRLPPDLDFDSNGATIADLLSMRSGISEYFADEAEFVEALTNDALHVWTTAGKLATVDARRGPVGPEREWEYTGTNFLLLGLIIEQVTGRSVAEVMRSGILSDDGYERLIYQPDEQPTDPMAMPRGASADTLDENGGYLPSLNNATMLTSEGAIASDAHSLARWFRALCAGEVVSPASLNDMTDFRKRPDYGLGIWDRRSEYGSTSGALGHTGLQREGYRTAALCFQQPAMVVAVLANDEEHDADTTAGNLWRAAGTQ
jgi:D-alanyl-D-alanine carboxypeptidase